MSLYKSGVHDGVLIALVSEARLTNEATLKQLGTELVKLAVGCETKKMLVNFEPVKFMSSAMLGQIVRLNKQCKNDNIKLKLCSIVPQVLEVFTITKLDKLIDIASDEAAALAAFSGAPAKKGWFK